MLGKRSILQAQLELFEDQFSPSQGRKSMMPLGEGDTLSLRAALVVWVLDPEIAQVLKAAPVGTEEEIQGPAPSQGTGFQRGGCWPKHLWWLSTIRLPLILWKRVEAKQTRKKVDS